MCEAGWNVRGATDSTTMGTSRVRGSTLISLRLILVNTNIQNSTWNSCSSRSRIWTSEACCTVTEFTEGHQYRRTDGLVGTGLMPYKAHCLKYQHFMLFPYSSWCCCFTQILFLDYTHRELYYELYRITALFLHVWHYHVLGVISINLLNTTVIMTYGNIISLIVLSPYGTVYLIM